MIIVMSLNVALKSPSRLYFISKLGGQSYLKNKWLLNNGIKRKSSKIAKSMLACDTTILDYLSSYYQAK